ncbi:MAG: efflux RND transporter periplasmic adaptor subunit [Acidobacteria bacterium]|nr:MAG: efflux RND transporter periplasmic adaptor subunit [Acidobacteriota bacterium]
MDRSLMKKFVIAAAVVVVAGAGYLYSRSGTAESETESAAAGGRGRFGGGGGGFGGGGNFGGGGGPRLPMTVELAAVSRADMAEQITVVGNLVGAATVQAAPKINGRLLSVTVRMGDRVTRGQTMARLEDSEIQEQVRQAEASFKVAEATVRQREADLRFSDTNLDRSRSLFERQLLSRQTLEDAESRQQASAAQLDLARAQLAQSQARVEELRINLTNTVVTSPVTGFVGSRTLDPGAWVTPNTAFISVVDISTVRLVANVVEKDLRRISAGLAAEVGVDAYPGEQFMGKVARVAPVLDPATRTAQIEVEIANPQGRLKPGMYANVRFTVDQRPKTLVVPTNAVVEWEGKRGVFVPGDGDTATFHPITLGLQDQKHTEVASGLAEGDRVITTGAASLREGDRIVLAGQSENGASNGSGARSGRAGRPGGSGQPGEFRGRSGGQRPSGGS